MAGVRMVLKHLRRGGCSVVLPDQVPGLGEGEWVDFFGRPAYTMTLLGRLQEASGAALVFCYARRLPRGEGYSMHFAAMDEALPADRREAARRVNAEVEKLVREAPEQYLWGYNRFKRPAGAPPPPPGAAGPA
jgi:KDO2-lipid IV(A) lauroyltransferase